MKRKLTLAVLMVLLAVLSLVVIRIGGTNAYDVQGFGLVFVRLNIWVLAVVFYQRLAAALGDDDLENDWTRINDGNLAVALYRVGEFAVVGIAAAVLVGKV